MTETAVAFFEKAEHALRSAKTLLNSGETEGCINRSYFAAYNAASAALAEVGETTRTHKGTHNRFWIRFVESGSISREIADVLSYGWRMREKADYDVFSVFDTSAAADLLNDVELFVKATKVLTHQIAER